MNEKIAIWGDCIPYNSNKNKYKDMEIKGSPHVVFQMLRFVGAIKGRKYKDIKSQIDTFTYVSEIKRGFERVTYEDVPYITPYLVEEGDCAVIVVPGGGYAYKSTDFEDKDKQGEGDQIAKKLNQAGISAFVLWYRSNPYRMPVPLLDVQRAVRYVRYHAEEYGINPDKIGIIGFSAGGFQVAGLINLLRNKNVLPDGYIEDEIDRVSDRVALAGLIYPCINFKYNVPMMFSAFPAEQVRNQVSREALLEKYDCIRHVQKNDPPQFICYGTKDTLVNPEQSVQYINALREKEVPYQSLIVKGAQHGFGACVNANQKFAYWLDSFIDWVGKQLTESQLVNRKMCDNMKSINSADWVTTFAASQVPSIMPRGKNHTVRIIIPANIEGNSLRLRFANNGEEIGTIDHVTIAKCDAKGNLLGSTCRQVTFHGKSNVKIAAGAEVVSDRAEICVRVKELLAVSIYCKESVKSQAGITGYVANAKKAGDFTEADFERKKMPKWLPALLSQYPTDGIPYLTGVDIETDSKPTVLCCFGDSVTAQSRWFKPLQKKLYRKYPGKIIMLNAGICGNRLLAETPGKTGAFFGKAGVTRIYKDVYEHQGITHILMAIGINDLNLSDSKYDGASHIPTVEEFRDGYRKVKKESEDRGIKLLSFSVYPGAADENREKIRQGYNRIIDEELGSCYININDILSNEDGNRYKKGYSFRDNVHLTNLGGKALIDNLDMDSLASLLEL